MRNPAASAAWLASWGLFRTTVPVRRPKLTPRRACARAACRRAPLQVERAAEALGAEAHVAQAAVRLGEARLRLEAVAVVADLDVYGAVDLRDGDDDFGRVRVLARVRQGFARDVQHCHRAVVAQRRDRWRQLARHAQHRAGAELFDRGREVGEQVAGGLHGAQVEDVGADVADDRVELVDRAIDVLARRLRGRSPGRRAPVRVRPMA